MSDSEEVTELKAEIFSLHNSLANLRVQLKDSEDELIEWIQRHADLMEQKDDQIAEKVKKIGDYEKRLFGSFFKRTKSAVLLLFGKI